MVSRQHLLEAILHEIDVCKHLFGKIPSEGFHFRFSERQRSTLELLRYLATCGIGPVRSLTAENWSLYDECDKEVESMRPEDFPAVMDRQGEMIREAFEAISDDDLEGKIVKAPGVAGALPLGGAIMRTSYAWLVAYRMQLFLHVKASGVPEIGTANNWAGIDWKPKEIEAQKAEQSESAEDAV